MPAYLVCLSMEYFTSSMARMLNWCCKCNRLQHKAQGRDAVGQSWQVLRQALGLYVLAL